MPDTVTLSTEPHISNTFGKYSDNPALRKLVYMETNTSCPENLDVLDALIDARHQVAVQQGFESYADRFLRDKMARNQDNVYAFLHSLQKRIHSGGQYRKEMETLSNAKQKVEQVQDGTLEPWDVPFYTGILKAQNGFDASLLSPYLTVPNCIDGMTTLVKQLFGITMVEETMGEDERWDSAEAQVRKFVFADETGRSLGTMYLDLHPREGKYSHAAHFTVQCGCVLDGTSETPEYQTPIVALVCNMSPGAGSLLNHHEVETSVSRIWACTPFTSLSELPFNMSRGHELPWILSRLRPTCLKTMLGIHSSWQSWLVTTRLANLFHQK